MPTVTKTNPTMGTISNSLLRERQPQMTQSRPARLTRPEPPNGDAGAVFEERPVVVPITTVAETVVPGVSFTLAGFAAHVTSFGAPEQAMVIVSLKVALAARVMVTTPFW